MQHFKVGDIVVPIDIKKDYGCGNLRDWFQKGIVAIKIYGLDETYIRSWRGINKEGQELNSTCCSVLITGFVLQAAKDMRNLTILTDEQRAGLSKDDQALIEAGVINDRLKLVDTNYVIEFLYKANKPAIAKQAAEDVAMAKAELKKGQK